MCLERLVVYACSHTWADDVMCPDGRQRAMLAPYPFDKTTYMCQKPEHITKGIEDRGYCCSDKCCHEANAKIPAFEHMRCTEARAKDPDCHKANSECKVGDWEYVQELKAKEPNAYAEKMKKMMAVPTKADSLREKPHTPEPKQD